jgi:hypothetical protein
MFSPVSAPAAGDYRSRLDDWDRKASVRTGPMHRAAADGVLLPFAPDLVPLMVHELVQRRDAATHKIILGQKLHSYKRFTAHLELRAVTRASFSRSSFV